MESSPVQRLMNRRTKTLIPTTATLLQPRVPYHNQDIIELRNRQKQQIKYYDRTAKDLPKLGKGDVVRMKPFKSGKKKWDKAIVTARLDERSYTVETPDGRRYRRNRCHLKKSAEKSNPIERIVVDKWQPKEELSDEDGQVTVPDGPQTPVLPRNQLSYGGESDENNSQVPDQSARSSRSQRTRKAPDYLKDYIH